VKTPPLLGDSFMITSHTALTITTLISWVVLFDAFQTSNPVLSNKITSSVESGIFVFIIYKAVFFPSWGFPYHHNRHLAACFFQHGTHVERIIYNQYSFFIN